MIVKGALMHGLPGGDAGTRQIRSLVHQKLVAVAGSEDHFMGDIQRLRQQECLLSGRVVCMDY